MVSHDSLTSNTEWFIADKRLGLLTDGEACPITARDIVGAEFKGRFPWDNSVSGVKPSEQFPDIQFHRFPLQVRVRITPPHGSQNASLTVEASGEGCLYKIDNLQSDQHLGDGHWFPLDQDDLDSISSALHKAGIREQGPLTLRQYLDLLSLRIDVSQLEFGEVDEAADNVLVPVMESPDKELAPGFKGKLYPYQQDGVNWLRHITSEQIGGILGDEMGLGKTVQILVMLAEQAVTNQEPSLIVAPATLLENWRREILKFVPGLKALIHQGAGRTGFPSELGDYDVIITSYDTALRDLGLLGTIDWNYVILDEAQAIKNPDTHRARAVKQLRRKVSIAVTGTPVENRLRDLWSIMDFACPGLLGQLSDFERRYDDTQDDAEDLEPLVSPLLLRRLVKDVAKDLPERLDIPQPISMPSSEVTRYEAIRREILDQYGKSATLVSLLKLRMYCTHPFLVDDGIGDPANASAKYRRLLEIMDEIVLAGHKTIIFTSYSEMIDLMLCDLGNRYPIHIDSIDGRTPVKERQDRVDHFQEAGIPSVLVLNPRAAGTGLNITAANHVIHYNLEWNPAIEDQATARAYRRGQKRIVTIHRLFYPNTVEQIIDERVAHKRLIAGSAVVGTSGDSPEDIARALEISPMLGYVAD